MIFLPYKFSFNEHNYFVLFCSANQIVYLHKKKFVQGNKTVDKKIFSYLKRIILCELQE